MGKARKSKRARGRTVDGSKIDGKQIAAIDLGSNSFHMVIARLRGEEVRPIDRVREPVQLARGLGKRKALTKSARQRAIRALERFSQRIRDVDPERVRAVGTSTLRSAKNSAEFLEEAEEALGHPIEVIKGREEARLIYLGVAHSLPDEAGPRLVVDIGGGSTECILGEHFEAHEVHSLDVGCVQLTKKFFPDGVLTRERFQAARLKAQGEFRTIERQFRDSGWSQAVGASGTIRAAETILRLNGWSGNGITAPALKRLRKAMIAAGHVKDLKLPALRARRARVFPGGVAILQALFDRLEVDSLAATSGALREGVLFDLLGRIRHEDVRERTIRGFQMRYRIDVAQAARVERMALALLSHAPKAWKLDTTRDGRLLSWAARLHELGLAVTWSKHHRHGGYLLRHADMPGFGRDDQRELAALVGAHRRKIDTTDFEGIGDDEYERIRCLLLILRLAVLLHRSRSPDPLPPMRLQGGMVRVRLLVTKRWLAANPLTELDLAEEGGHLEALGFEFAVGS